MVKCLVHILIWTIFLSVAQFSQAAKSVHDMLPMNYSETSCSMEQANCCDIEEESNCCSGDDCECSCCLHIVYIHAMDGAFAQNFPVFIQEYTWEFHYHKDFLHGVFHPPLA